MATFSGRCTAFAVLGLLSGFSVSCGPSAEARSAQVEAQPEQASPAAPGQPRAAAPSDSSPERVPELEQATTRERAVHDLIARYDQVAANGTKTEAARAFAQKYVAALTQAYVDGHSDLSAKTRQALLNLLVSFDDSKAVPAHTLALSHYAKTREGVDEAIWACRAAQTLTDGRLQSALLLAFESIDMSDKHGRRFGAHLQSAMQHNRTNSWSAVLQKKLDAPINRPESFNDEKAVRAFQNQLFWQSTAAQLLGDLGVSAAVRPLLLARLDKTKRDVHAQAELALLKLGKDAAVVAEGLLLGSDPELVEKARLAEPELKEPHVFFGADMLGKIGTPTSRAALIASWEKTNDPVSRALIAHALSKLPKDPAAFEIWKKTYLGTKLETTLPRGESALEVLAEGAPFWFSAELVPWLSQRAAAAPGKGSRKGDLQRALIVSMGHLVTAAQVKAVAPTAQEFGGRTGTPAFAQATELLTECNQLPACYLKHAAAPENQTDDRAMITMKSAVMIGLLGDPASRDALLKIAMGVQNRRVQEAMARSLEHLTEPGDTAFLAALKDAVFSPKKTQGTAGEELGPSPLELTYYRLRAR